MKRKRPAKYVAVQAQEGVWYRAKGYNHTQCCDCALVHREEFKMEDGQLFWRAIRDDKETEAQRAALGIKVIRADKG